MNISLSKFESAIDIQIVSRGHGYFSNGAVSSLKQIKDDSWVAYVDGTERYKIRVILKGDDVVDYSCSCPYDLGPVCKHIVAVLYKLRNRLYSQNKKSGKTEKSSKTKRETTPHESLEQTLSHMPRKSLEKIILEYAVREPEIADYIFAKKTLAAPASDKEEYRNIIKSSIGVAMGRHGFIGYWEASKAVEGAEMVLDKAEELISRSDAPKAMPIYQCILEEIVPLLQHADDSNGEIGSAIEEAFEGLSICVRLAKGEFRKKLLDYLFDEFEHKRYDEWSSWKWKFLELTAQTVDTPQEQERLFKKLDQVMKRHEGSKDDWSDSYDIETILGIRLAVLERRGRDEEIESFLKEHIFYPAMREQLIKRAFERKDFALVKKLAQDGIALGKQQNLPGLVNGWNVCILKAADAEHNIPEIKKYALMLFLETGDFDYYKQYKKCFSQDEWREEVERVIGKSRSCSDNIIAQIFIYEQRWSDLLTYVQKDMSSYMIESYEKYLSSRFPQELAVIYEKVITEELAPETGRGNYQRTCQFLRRMKKMGLQERVKALIEELSTKYKNRPAFLEEIKRV